MTGDPSGASCRLSELAKLANQTALAQEAERSSANQAAGRAVATAYFEKLAAGEIDHVELSRRFEQRLEIPLPEGVGDVDGKMTRVKDLLGASDRASNELGKTLLELDVAVGRAATPDSEVTPRTGWLARLPLIGRRAEREVAKREDPKTLLERATSVVTGSITTAERDEGTLRDLIRTCKQEARLIGEKADQATGIRLGLEEGLQHLAPGSQAHDEAQHLYDKALRHEGALRGLQADILQVATFAAQARVHVDRQVEELKTNSRRHLATLNMMLAFGQLAGRTQERDQLIDALKESNGRARLAMANQLASQQRLELSRARSGDDRQSRQADRVMAGVLKTEETIDTVTRQRRRAAVEALLPKVRELEQTVEGLDNKATAAALLNGRETPPAALGPTNP